MTDPYHSITIQFGGGTTEAYYPVPVGTSVPRRIYPDTISIGGRPFTINTSFEPYRREAFRHRTILPQRQSINFENVAGYGTLNTEGLWRRDQLDWSEGAGQQFLDRKTTSSASRFYKSQGVNPWYENQLTLLNDVAQRADSTAPNTKAIAVSGVACVLDGTGITFYQSDGSNWDSPNVCTVTWGTTPDYVFDICTDGTIVYIATTSGIYTVDTSTITFSSTPSTTTPALYLNTGTIQNYTAKVTGFTGSSGGDTISTTLGGVPSLIQPGMTVVGTNIPSGTTVVSVDTSSTTVTLSNNLSGAIAATELLSFDVAVAYTITAYTMVRVCNDALIAAATQDASPITNLQVPYSATSANCLLALTTVPTTTTPQANQILMIHPDSKWVWSSACGGATQIYVGGFDFSNASAEKGAVYRSSMTGATAVTSVNQPFQLNYPVQTLPLETGEYPTCLYSYLNYIFLGTNLGIRMCQTLSIYDPSATQTGDLKAGPLAPNLLQPVAGAVTGIVGYGRFIYFTWLGMGGIDSGGSPIGPSGVGRMDLTTSIGGDSLSLAYTTDICMDPTYSAIPVWVDVDPIYNGETYNETLLNSGYIMFTAVSNSGGGVYSADPTKFVSSGWINSGAITYGISDPKIPVQMDMSADIVNPTGMGIELDMFSPSGSDIYVQPPNYTGQQVTIPGGFRSERINTIITLRASDDQSQTSTLYRYTLKSWPAAISETLITPVVTFGRNNLSGFQVEFSDPYENFWYLQQLLQNQTIVPYIEGPLSANVVVQELDWLPSKLQDNYEQGFVGDCVVYLKTIGGYQYNPTPTQ